MENLNFSDKDTTFVSNKNISKIEPLSNVNSHRTLFAKAALSVLLGSACNSGSVELYGDNDSEERREDVVDTGVEDTGFMNVEDVPNQWAWDSEGEAGVSKGEVLLESFPDTELSGVVFHKGLNSYFVVSDEGGLFQLDRGGNVVSNWGMNGDLEGLALDEDSDTLFVANEEGSVLNLWDLVDNNFVPEAYCSLNVPVDGNAGLEAITFVANGDAPVSWGNDPLGFIVAGTQASLELFVFPVGDCEGGNEIDSVSLDSPLLTSRDDVSGLDYNATVDQLYVLHDDGNKLDVMGMEGDIRKTYDLPGGDHEGVFLRSVSCTRDIGTLLVVEDGGFISEWSDFPTVCR